MATAKEKEDIADLKTDMAVVKNDIRYMKTDLGKVVDKLDKNSGGLALAELFNSKLTATVVTALVAAAIYFVGKSAL